jgi:hypothetical protein
LGVVHQEQRHPVVVIEIAAPLVGPVAPVPLLVALHHLGEGELRVSAGHIDS